MHAMPSLPAAQAADIVIGDRHGRTASPWLVDAVTGWLTQHGCRVTRNLPYAGGYGVEQHGQPANAIHAIQIEIDRRLYLEADGMTRSEERRVGKECVSTGRYGGGPEHEKKKTKIQRNISHTQ